MNWNNRRFAGLAALALLVALAAWQPAPAQVIVVSGHVVTANYVEDSMHNQTGRSFIFSVKWNFGKLNAAKSRNAEGLRRDLDRMNSNYLLR